MLVVTKNIVAIILNSFLLPITEKMFMHVQVTEFGQEVNALI